MKDEYLQEKNSTCINHVQLSITAENAGETQKDIKNNTPAELEGIKPELLKGWR